MAGRTVTVFLQLLLRPVAPSVIITVSVKEHEPIALAIINIEESVAEPMMVPLPVRDQRKSALGVTLEAA